MMQTLTQIGRELSGHADALIPMIVVAILYIAIKGEFHYPARRG